MHVLYDATSGDSVWRQLGGKRNFLGLRSTWTIPKIRRRVDSEEEEEEQPVASGTASGAVREVARSSSSSLGNNSADTDQRLVNMQSQIDAMQEEIAMLRRQLSSIVNWAKGVKRAANNRIPEVDDEEEE